MGWSGKLGGGVSYLMKQILEIYIGISHGFWECQTVRNTVSLNRIGKEKDKMKRRQSDSLSSIVRKKADGLLICKHMLAFPQQEGRRQGWHYGPQGWNPEPQDYSEPWNLMTAAQLGLEVLGLVIPFFLSCSDPRLFNGNIYTCCPMPDLPLYLEADSLFSSFTGCG
jgi:hypothetical protein